ncbi:MAG: DEAD/DEAH box helicase, partial [Streptosporangiaceae bacterium]
LPGLLAPDQVAMLLRRITGTRPVVVLSDEAAATCKIAAFASSQDRWMVAVRMVSEGVDIPRLAVGVYATSVSTALYFAQAVGRFVRARRRGETASVFLPSIPSLLGYAAELENERDHVLAGRDDDDDEEKEFAEAQRQRDTPDTFDEPAFKPLEASAHFDRALYDGGEFGTSAEEEDFLGLPGLLAPDQVAMLLRQRQADQVKKRAKSGAAGSPAAAAVPAQPPPPATTRQTLAALRKELNGLIGAWHHRTGQPHGVIHADLRRACGGPPLPEATADQIRARIETMRRWASAS